jgi:queuine tRNA-ribosyltransferase
MKEVNYWTKLGGSGRARLGRYKTRRGEFDTPNFMPVGTKGTVKGVDCERIKESGAQIMLVNTYHLWLRPGPALIRKLGDIHKFSGWNGPILSDSGGFQVFSLSGIRKLREEGVEFRSHIDGAKMFLSPETSIGIQEELGVDIAMVLDECPPPSYSYDQSRDSLEMTIRWAKRSLAARKDPTTAIFGITQGSFAPDLRAKAAAELGALEFDGLAIGGLSVGEEKSKMYDVLSYHPEQLPADKIRYLMGVGTPMDILEAVRNGVDLFDCVMPTRSGRFGRAFIRGAEPYINIRNARFAESQDPLDPKCGCIACRNYSAGYIHHLFRVDEMLGPVLLSAHNLKHYLDLMAEIRCCIKDGSFEDLYNSIKNDWSNVSLGSPESSSEQ